MAHFKEILSDVFLLIYPSEDLAELYRSRHKIILLNFESSSSQSRLKLQDKQPNLLNSNATPNPTQVTERRKSSAVDEFGTLSKAWFSSRFYNRFLSTRLYSFFGLPNHRRSGNDPLSLLDLLKNFSGWEDRASDKKKIFNALLAPFRFVFNVCYTLFKCSLNIVKLFTEFLPKLGYAICMQKIKNASLKGQAMLHWKIASFLFLALRLIGGAITSPIANLKLAWMASYATTGNDSLKQKIIGYGTMTLSLIITFTIYALLFPIALKSLAIWASSHLPTLAGFFSKASISLATKLIFPTLQKIGVSISTAPATIGAHTLSTLVTAVSLIFTPIYKSAIRAGNFLFLNWGLLPKNQINNTNQTTESLLAAHSSRRSVAKNQKQVGALLLRKNPATVSTLVTKSSNALTPPNSTPLPERDTASSLEPPPTDEQTIENHSSTKNNETQSTPVKIETSAAKTNVQLLTQDASSLSSQTHSSSEPIHAISSINPDKNIQTTTPMPNHLPTLPHLPLLPTTPKEFLISSSYEYLLKKQIRENKNSSSIPHPDPLSDIKIIRKKNFTAPKKETLFSRGFFSHELLPETPKPILFPIHHKDASINREKPFIAEMGQFGNLSHSFDSVMSAKTFNRKEKPF